MNHLVFTLLDWLRCRCVELSEAPALRGERIELLDIAAHASEPLRVAVTGDVSTGKSTLVNALIGQRVAEVQRKETTAEVTWFRCPGTSTPPPLGAAHVMRAVSSPLLARITLADTPGVNTVSGNEVHSEQMLAAGTAAAGSVSALVYLCLAEISEGARRRMRTFSALTTGPLDEGANIIMCGSKADQSVGDDPARRAELVSNLRKHAGRYAASVVAVSPALALASVDTGADPWLADRIGLIASTPPLLDATSISWESVRDTAVIHAPALTPADVARLQGLTGTLLGVARAAELRAQNPSVSAAEIRARWRAMSGLDALVGLLEHLVDNADVLTISAVRSRLGRLAVRLGHHRGGMVRQVLDRLFRHPAMENYERRAAALLLDHGTLMRHVPDDDRRAAAQLLRGYRAELPTEALARWHQWAGTGGFSSTAQRVASIVLDRRGFRAGDPGAANGE